MYLSKNFNYVLQLWIGPTHDDITAQSISKAFKLKYEYHKEHAILENITERKNLMMEEKNGKNTRVLN